MIIVYSNVDIANMVRRITRDTQKVSSIRDTLVLGMLADDDNLTNHMKDCLKQAYEYNQSFSAGTHSGNPVIAHSSVVRALVKRKLINEFHRTPHNPEGRGGSPYRTRFYYKISDMGKQHCVEVNYEKI